MSGSGARDGFGSPPWGPADPVPELEDTQALPGLGPVSGPGEAPGRARGGNPGGDRGGFGASSWQDQPSTWQDQPQPSSWQDQSPSWQDQPSTWQDQPQPSSWQGQPSSWQDQSPSWQDQPSTWQDQPQPSSWQGQPSSWQGQPQPSSWQDESPSWQGQHQPSSWQDRGGPDQSQWQNPDSRDQSSWQSQGGPDQSPWQDPGRQDPGRQDPGRQDPGVRATRAEQAIGDDAGARDSGDAADSGGAGVKKPPKRRHFWRELPVLVVIALVLALIIKTFAIQAFFIPTGSMQNTLAIGDRVLINKIVYHLRPIERGDIIVFDGTGSWDPSAPASSNIFSKALNELEGIVGVNEDPNIYIKRVIGLPGDVVACCNSKHQVTVNGVGLNETSYVYPGNPASTPFGPYTVPAGRLWVMGDHRSVSYDSRGHVGDPGGGTIPESAVLGRAFVIIWPPSQWGFLNIPATFEQPRLNASSAAGGNAAAGGSSAALEAALDNGTPIQPANSPLPLALGFAGAVPLTWLQRKARRRLIFRRRRRSAGS